MAIHEWWATDPEERFWMEATDREVLGEDLRAPLSSQAGREVWHYALVSHTRPGDVVFHWHTTLHERPALVGWSTVLGPLREEQHEWTPHAGALDTPAAARPNWVTTLGGIQYLDEPVSLDKLEARRAEVLGIRDDLEAIHGKPTYFPFNGYGNANIRAAQAYLTKMPLALVGLLDLPSARHAGADQPLDAGSSSPDMRAGGQGFLRDTARKLATERHAIDMAVAHYRAIGGTEITVLGKPYDLRLNLDGEEVHVEVKGSGNDAAQVFVTRNEVAHARTYPRTELLVVDRIKWERSENGDYKTADGRLRRWATWNPADSSLTAMTYSHVLPPDDMSMGH